MSLSPPLNPNIFIFMVFGENWPNNRLTCLHPPPSLWNSGSIMDCHITFFVYQIKGSKSTNGHERATNIMTFSCLLCLQNWWIEVNKWPWKGKKHHDIFCLLCSPNWWIEVNKWPWKGKKYHDIFLPSLFTKLMDRSQQIAMKGQKISWHFPAFFVYQINGSKSTNGNERAKNIMTFSWSQWARKCHLRIFSCALLS